MPNLHTIRVGPYRRPTNEIATRFRQATGLNLFHYWDTLTGFDVLKFDAQIQTPDGVSTREHLRVTRGDVAVQVVEDLLDA